VIKFKTLSYGTEIQAVEVRKETLHHVVLLHGQREAKFSHAYKCGYFDTWEDARKSLLRRATEKRQIIQADLGRINAEIDAINAMAVLELEGAQ
jgi:hypothetical protein